MNLGVIHFPLEYNGGDYVQVVDGVDKSTGQEILKTHELTLEEQTAWVNIDLMKNEITSIQKTTNSENTTVTYALTKSTMIGSMLRSCLLIVYMNYVVRIKCASLRWR